MTNAGAYPFEAAGFDLVFSRLGVMFFGDAPAAFANLRRAVRCGRAGGRPGGNGGVLAASTSHRAR